MVLFVHRTSSDIFGFSPYCRHSAATTFRIETSCLPKSSTKTCCFFPLKEFLEGRKERMLASKSWSPIASRIDRLSVNHDGHYVLGSTIVKWHFIIEKPKKGDNVLFKWHFTIENPQKGKKIVCADSATICFWCFAHSTWDSTPPPHLRWRKKAAPFSQENTAAFFASVVDPWGWKCLQQLAKPFLPTSARAFSLEKESKVLQRKRRISRILLHSSTACALLHIQRLPQSAKCHVPSLHDSTNGDQTKPSLAMLPIPFNLRCFPLPTDFRPQKNSSTWNAEECRDSTHCGARQLELAMRQKGHDLVVSEEHTFDSSKRPTLEPPKPQKS